MRINLAQYHPIADLQGNIVFAGNGNLIFCYELHLPEVYSLSETDFEEIHATFFQGLKTLPAGSVIHKQDIYQKEKYSPDKLPDKSFLDKATCRYFNGRQFIKHRSFLFLTWTGNTAFNSPSYVNPFKKNSSAFPIKMTEEALRFQGLVQETAAYINASGKIRMSALEEGEILGLTSEFFNGFQKDFDTGILLNPKNIQVGNNFFDVLAVNSEEAFGSGVRTSKSDSRFTSDDFIFHQGLLDGLGLNLTENHVLNQIIYLDDRHRWRRVLEKRIEELKKSVNFGSQNKILLEKVQEIHKAINDDESSRIVRGQLNVLFWDENQENLPGIASRVKAEFKDLDITPYYPLGEDRKHFFLNSFFCFSSNFSNADLYVMDLKHSLCLLTSNTNYQSDEEGILFNDRQYNIPVLKDVWDEKKKRIKARNFAIFAPTGEGKSFLANNILRQFFETGTRLVIIDLGGSYTKFAKLYPDNHILLRYEQGKSLGINPFYIKDSENITPERIEDLTGFLFELYASGQPIKKSQEVALKKILRYYFQETTSGHSLGNFYAFIAGKKVKLLADLEIREDYFNVEDFLHIMSEYVGEGLYSFLFEQEKDQTYRIEDKQLIIFELDEVKDSKEILSVMLKLIKSAIQRTIWRNRSEKGIILFDEFAKQLKFKNVLESVEFYYQAIRKQNGAIGIVLQSINQLPQNSTSASILENTQVIYSLHNEKGYDDLRERLHLSSHDLNQLRSIRNKLSGKRKYTEIFIKIGKHSNIFRLEVPPEAYAAYLTDGPENQEILKLFEQYGTMEKAITEYLIKNKNQ